MKKGEDEPPEDKRTDKPKALGLEHGWDFFRSACALIVSAYLLVVTRASGKRVVTQALLEEAPKLSILKQWWSTPVRKKDRGAVR